jgi:hypothetical protein
MQHPLRTHGGRGTIHGAVGRSCIILGFRESEIGDCSIGAVLDTLVPSYRETTTPIPLPTYQGRNVIRQEGISSEVGSVGQNGEETGKEFSWSRGLGIEISPIKTRSARRKEGTCSTTIAIQNSIISDNGVLRGMKSLAREKS